MQGVGVVFGKNGDGANTEVGGSARDANGNLTAIGDEQFLKGHEQQVRWMSIHRTVPRRTRY
jgi:hypothetical protein